MSGRRAGDQVLEGYEEVRPFGLGAGVERILRGAHHGKA
jgi:hypothetical protein